MSGDLFINAHLTLPGAELSWCAARASGPGGQNVNKVSTKVELRFDIQGSKALTSSVKLRLRGIAGGRLDSEGQLVIVSQQARTQHRNLELARAKLAELVRQALAIPKRRRPTAPSAGSIRRRLEAKRHRAERKRDRRPPTE